MPFLKRKTTQNLLAKNSVKNSLLNGFRPLIVLSNGSKYIGQWKNGQKDEFPGFGREVIDDNYIYEGNFKNDKRNGHGILRVRLSNGDYKRLYVGEWLNNRRVNHGRQYFPDGIYNGEYENGDRSGRGIMWYNDKESSMYIGKWKHDLYHGPGVLFDGIQSRYEGFFENGKKHGEGTFYHLLKGQVQIGVWSKGVCISSTMEDASRNECRKPTRFPIPQKRVTFAEEMVPQTEEVAESVCTTIDYQRLWPNMLVDNNIETFIRIKRM